MSSGQAQGEDEHTNIYSMVAVYFNKLTGEKPCNGETTEEIVQQHVHAPVFRLPPCPSVILSGLDNVQRLRRVAIRRQPCRMFWVSCKY